MKQSINSNRLKLLTLASGLLGLLLYVILLGSGTDEKGLLVPGFWAGTAMCVLTAVMLPSLFLLTRNIQGTQQYAKAHPNSPVAALGAFAASFTVVYATVSGLGTSSILLPVLSGLTAVALALVGFCRFKAMCPHFLCSTLLCAFLALRMINQYQNWNSDPQILNYIFYLGAYIALMLTAYQHAAFDAGLGSHKNLWCASMISVFLCMTALPHASDPVLLLGMAAWALTNTTRPGYVRTSREEV